MYFNSDAERLAYYERTVFPEEFWSFENCRSIADKNIGKFYITVIDDFGYAAGISMMSDTELLKIGVLPHHRRKGHGERLLKEFIKKAVIQTEQLYVQASWQERPDEFNRNVKLEKIFLEVRESNVSAQNLYKKAGFEIYGIRKKYYSSNQEDAILMRLIL